MKAKFKRTVDSGDLEGTRISLANEMMLDPRGDSFIEMRRYAESSFPNLYDAYNGVSFEKNQNNWDEALLFSTRNALDNNFSKECLDFYYNLAKAVLKEKAETLNREKESKMVYQGQDLENKMTSERSKKGKPLYFGLAIGGLLLGGIGLIMGKAIITTIGFAGTAVGGCLMFNASKK